jgi:hypothetical protein
MRLAPLLRALQVFLCFCWLSSSARAATPKACDLVTAQTAASLAGEAVGAGNDVPSQGW